MTWTNVFAVIGFFHLAAFLLGAIGIGHYRLYMGTEDKVIVSKSEYEALKEKVKEYETKIHS